MRTSIRETHSRTLTARSTFSALVLLAILALVIALAGSNNTAQAQLPTLPAGGGTTVPPNPPVQEKIVFVRVSPASDWDLYTMNPDGSNPTPLTTGPAQDRFPAWSPDGSKVAFSRYDSSTSIYDLRVINADGSGEHVIRSGLYSRLSWSPDGSRIAFGNYEIFVMNADGSGATQLTTDATSSYYPAWSLDGSKIAFGNQRRDGDTDLEIYVMNSDGSNQQMIANPPSGSHYVNPAWSPDGSKIAFVGGSSTGHVYTMNSDGSNISQVPNAVGNDGVAWSPDGLQIAYQCNLPGAQICVINTDGSNLHNISSTTSEACNCDWQRSRHVIQVQGEDGTPIDGAKVYNECTLMGTTNLSGTLVLAGNLALYDRLIARKQVHEEPTQKGGHDGWAYRVYLTNIKEEDDGSETPFVVTDTNQITQTIVISSTNTQIGFNIVASVEYNDTAEHLNQIAQGFLGANQYLMDVTDGQMYFEQVKLYDNNQHFDDADYQFQASVTRSNADAEPDGVSALTSPSQHIHMSSPDNFGIPYSEQSAYSTLVHEFGHYAIGAYDEYYKFNPDDYATQCTADFPAGDYDERASIMFDQRQSSEFCSTIAPDVHNPDTAQGYIHGESVWQTVVDNYSDDQGLWQLKSPITRGVVDPGPNAPLCLGQYGATVDIVNAPGPTCSRVVQVNVRTQDGQPVVGADIVLHQNNNYVFEQQTDNGGDSYVIGVSTGETIHATTFLNGQSLNGDGIAANCDDLIPITITQSLAPQMLPQDPEQMSLGSRGVAGDALSKRPNVPTAWPAHWLEAVPDWSQHVVTATLHLAGDPPGQSTLYASQDTLNRQPVSLTYNASLHQYIGTYVFSPTVSPDFLFELELPTAGGVAVSTYSFNAGQYHTTGPSGYEKLKNMGAPHGNNPNVPPIAWNVLHPESQADVIVNPSSLPEGTGVMVGTSGMPADRPTNLIPVGGPYSIQGQNPISGEVGITLAYKSEYFCGLVPGSASIYRYTGSGWQAIPTSLIDEWHQAGGKITQWGIYGVFAQPNPRVVFSDVPQGSTFYDYINWITCHGIASGYADGTFRPSNNASRGQISKMMALTYRWHLDPPSGQSNTRSETETIKWRWNTLSDPYTFADVLPGSTFYLYGEAAYREGVVSGYPCGGAGEPCDAQNRPYFRPSNNVTRGQIAKIISNGSKFDDVVSGQTFEDVAPGSTFYDFVGRMASRQIINGYACGGPGEPCGVGNLPYFRPSANATRGQLSKMIYLAAQPR